MKLKSQYKDWSFKDWIYMFPINQRANPGSGIGVIKRAISQQQEANTRFESKLEHRWGTSTSEHLQAVSVGARAHGV
jgi:hypothetical protein